MPSSRGSSQPRDRSQVSRIASGLFTVWAIREAPLHLVWETHLWVNLHWAELAADLFCVAPQCLIKKIDPNIIWYVLYGESKKKKKGPNEHIYQREIESQMQKTNLWLATETNTMP